MRFTEAHVPSTKASLWKKIVNRMMEETKPLRRFTDVRNFLLDAQVVQEMREMD